MTAEVWLEVALNGPWSRAVQPGIPDTVERIVRDGIACAEAGASLLHVHAYDAEGTPQTFDWQVYARIIEGIRNHADIVVYPSIPSASIGVSRDAANAAERYAHYEPLARRGLLEIAVVDPGSCNFITPIGVSPQLPSTVYINSDEHIRHGLDLAARLGFKPGYAIYEPGFTRTGAARAAETPGCSQPVYRFMFSDTFAWGFPPREWALEAHLNLLAECAPGAAWMVAGLGVDISPLIGPAVRRGGHVRVGLEDAPLGTALTNLQWTEHAVRLIREAGGEPASPATVLAQLKR